MYKVSFFFKLLFFLSKERQWEFLWLRTKPKCAWCMTWWRTSPRWPQPTPGQEVRNNDSYRLKDHVAYFLHHILSYQLRLHPARIRQDVFLWGLHCCVGCVWRSHRQDYIKRGKSMNKYRVCVRERERDNESLSLLSGFWWNHCSWLWRGGAQNSLQKEEWQLLCASGETLSSTVLFYLQQESKCLIDNVMCVFVSDGSRLWAWWDRG